MRKGLVTLGVVALVLAVSQSFAEAPILSCLPDVRISDVEQNSQTADFNLFIFSDAIELDEYVQDGDTPLATLRWSGLDTAGSIEINGVALDVDPNNSSELLEPGAKDFRAATATGMATFRDALRYGDTTFTDPSAETLVEIYVSDGTTVTQGTMKVITMNATNDVGDGDAVLPVEQQTFGFDASEEGWTWFGIDTATIDPAGHAFSAGALTMTEPATHSNIIFGGWESPKDPAAAVTPKMGCVMRARYMISSTQASATSSPGMRFRVLTFHVSNPGTGWDVDFINQDTTSNDWLQYSTIDFAMGGGEFDSRVPSATGTEYTILSFPLQVADTLLSEEPGSPVVHYFSCDMLDLEGGFENDSGTYSIDSAVIDGIDRPNLGAGTAVAGMSFTDFTSGWTTGKKSFTGGTPPATLVVAAGADLTITVAPGNEQFEAFAEMTTGVALNSGQFYRLAFTCRSTETSSGDQGPLVNAGVTSGNFVYTAAQTLAGGGTFSRLSSSPKVMEVWIVAPSEMTSTPGMTEPMKASFKSWLESNSVPQFPSNRFVSGTVTCESLQTEAFVLTDMGLEPAP